MFSDNELSKLLSIAPSLEGKFFKNTCMEIYKDIVLARGVRDDVERVLKSLVKQGRESESSTTWEDSVSVSRSQSLI